MTRQSALQMCAETLGLGIPCPSYAAPGSRVCLAHGGGPQTSPKQPTGVEDWRQRWQTPRSLARAAFAEFGFDHDAAADAHNALCPSFWSREHSALDRYWPTDLRIWCNPPFGTAEAFSPRQLKHREHGGFSGLLVIDRGAQWLDRALQVAQWWRFTGRVEYELPPDAPQEKKTGVTFGSVFAIFDKSREPGFMGWRDPKTFAWARDRRGRRL